MKHRGEYSQDHYKWLQLLNVEGYASIKGSLARRDCEVGFFLTSVVGKASGRDKTIIRT